MKTFEDLVFKPHPKMPGLMAQMFFTNGYGISVVRFKMPTLDFPFLNPAIEQHSSRIYGSYTSNENEWEVAVLEGIPGDWEISGPFEENPMGYKTPPEVTEIMKEVQSLAAAWKDKQERQYPPS